VITNYKSLLEANKDPNKFYAIIFKPSEDRGGCRKPVAIAISDKS
jgi:hypothetical protein